MFNLAPLRAWTDLPFFTQDLPDIESKLHDTSSVLPRPENTFRALELCQPQDTKVVILGQDPYHTPQKADGLAFSIAETFTGPLGSLGNIYKELENDLNIKRHSSALDDWARQGVLLLNTALSVKTGHANAHAKLGWSKLTVQILAHLSPEPRAFVLWGRHAQAFQKHITPSTSPHEHLMITSAHPSGLSAHRGFFGSAPFSRIDAWLNIQNKNKINWGGEA